ncbi:conserved hypothetical protein [Neospora caninum Liverpool]|uniref:Phosphodiesterase n=1 Tax=Neospora caninum (strain Liverpool) TaxID=572307 RepID=F0VID9_NEOCL|nr:conserved hypothetical protein [Neospora caninum Liverpool]CBZ53500.1 conserved hypothetical protein [Neospora caninum Liverpool]CEL67488.1 TPA: cAMP-specific 3',5'-cyclic phosphodiesterase, isoform F [Neospora caninum Liverpool]|eukprot:XP_003883532.1 conserved hypothetical protein [Neospora caninum Liverpool]
MVASKSKPVSGGMFAVSSPLAGSRRTVHGGLNPLSVPGGVLGQKSMRMGSIHLGSTHNSTTALKTTHQEKTYAMYHTYADAVTENGGRLETAHWVSFILLLVAILITTSSSFYFIARKNLVMDTLGQLDQEAAAVRNITMKLDVAEATAQWSFSVDTRPFAEAAVITPELVFAVQTRFVRGANTILSALEILRSADLAASTSSKCVSPDQTSQGGKQPCPLKTLLSQLRRIDTKFYNTMMAMVLEDRLHLTEVLNAVIVNRLPGTWPEVTGPMSFLFFTAREHAKVKAAVQSYLTKLNNLTADVANEWKWEIPIWCAGATAVVLSSALVGFLIAIIVFARRLQKAFESCQKAFFESVEELRSKIDEMADFMHALFEYRVTAALHVLNGVAALLGASSALTPYHQKVLKVMEKCVVDTEAATVNAISCLSSEIEVPQLGTEETNIRAVVEDCLEIFSSKTEARGVPVTCTFGAGCPSVAMADSHKLRTILTKVLSFVVDHTLEKGRGVDVFVNANASASRPGDSLEEFRGFDIHFEVKGHGVYMDNREAQDLGHPKSLLKRSGHGLRMLCTAKLLQTMGGTMQILSSPSRGTFVSFQIRTRARFRLLDFHRGFRSFSRQRQRILWLGLTPETSRALQFLCNDVGLQFTTCYCLRHLREALETDPRALSLAFILGDFVKLSADPADPSSRPLSSTEIFKEAQEAAAAARAGAAGALPLVKVFVSSQGDSRAQDGKENVEHEDPLPDDVIKLVVPVRTDALVQILARALDNVEGGRSSEASDEEDSESEDDGVHPIPGEPISPSPQSDRGKEAAGTVRKSLFIPSHGKIELLQQNYGKRGEGAHAEKKKRSTVRISMAPRRTMRLSASPRSQRESSMASEGSRHRNLIYSVFKGRDVAPRKSLFPGGSSIPEPLLFDVNSVVQAVNQIGLSRPAGQLAAAIAEAPFQKDLDASAKFVDVFDSSLALLRYYQSLAPHKASSQRRRETGLLNDPDPHGVDRTWRPQAKRKDPLATMRSLSSLHAKVPTEPEVQAFFNLASCALTLEEEPVNIHQVLSWDFHVLNLTPSMATRVARDILHHFAVTAQVEVPGEILMGFAVALYKNYQPNPYHNFFHALNVAQICCLLMALPDVAAQFQPIDYFVLSVAALGHDLGHPGTNNLFVNRNNCMPSRLYQNHSVLENYHAALLFQILRNPRFNVFCSIPPQTFSSCRQRIISAILWTDMAKHFDMVARLKEKIEGEMVLTEGIIVTLQKPYLEGLLLHASDISNPMLHFDLSYDWAVRACDEFFQQNKLEEKLGQPPHMPAFVEFDIFNVAKCQVNFIDFICRPLFGSLAQMFPAQLGDRAAELRKNRNKWKAIIDERTQKLP